MAKIKRGQGISALLSSIDSELEENAQEVITTLAGQIAEIPILEIEVNPFQPRQEFDQTALHELSESIRIHGLIQPITVRRLENNKYQLISGERRFRASIIAGLTAVPAYLRVANDQEMLEMALVENIQRQDLNSIEVAVTYKRLMDECNLTHEELSGRVGKNRSTVTNYLRLLKLPPAIQVGIRENRISMGHARALVTVEDIGLQLMLYNQCVQQGLSVRQIEQLVANQQTPKGDKPQKEKKDADIKKVEDNLCSYFGAKVNIKRNPNGKGQIIVPFVSDSDLNRILDLVIKDE